MIPEHCGRDETHSFANNANEWGTRRRSQMAFAALSVCHRIAFAQMDVAETGLRIYLAEKKTKRVGCLDSTGHFLQSGSKAELTESRQFLAILAEM